MKNLHETFYAQYANSPILTGILSAFNQAADPISLIDLFIRQVLDPLTAKGWGLDVWGRIVGVGRVLKLPQEDFFFGFAEAAAKGDSNVTGFTQGRFYKKHDVALTQNYPLTDEAFRKLIFAKAAANITDGAIASLNAILMDLFGEAAKNIWIEEGNGQTGSFFDFAESLEDATNFNEAILRSPAFSGILNMSLLICYDWAPSSLELTLIHQAGRFICPSGVRISTQYVPPLPRMPKVPKNALWNADTGYLITSNETYLI